MPGVLTGDQIVHEDLSDAYLQSDVRKTPVTSRVKKGEKLKNMLFSWAIEKMDGRRTTAPPENQDVTGFEGDKQFRMYNRAQKFWRTPHVSTEANEINQAAADFGKYVKQVTKKTKEQQRDVEVRYLDDQDSNDDNGTVGAQFKGIGMVINDQVSVGLSGAALASTDAQTQIPAQFLTPTKQIYVGNLIDVNGAPVFFEDALLDMLQSRFDNLGMTSELIMYADSVLKRHMSKFFGKYKANVQGYTTVVKTEQEAIDAKEFALYGADVYNTDFGPMMVELMQWAPKLSTGGASGRGYVLNLDMLSLRPSGLWMTHREFEDRGAGPRGLIQSIIGHEYGDPRTHCKIDPVAIQGS
jgi:hypothetical protein